MQTAAGSSVSVVKPLYALSQVGSEVVAARQAPARPKVALVSAQQGDHKPSGGFMDTAVNDVMFGFFARMGSAIFGRIFGGC